MLLLHLACSLGIINHRAVSVHNVSQYKIIAQAPGDCQWEMGLLGGRVCGKGEGTHGCRPAGALALGDAGLLYACRPSRT